MPGGGGRIGDTLRLPAGRRARVTVVTAVLLVAALLGAGVGIGAPALADRLGLAVAGPEPTAPPPPPVQVVPVLRALPDGAPTPTPAGVAVAVAPLVEAGLGTVSGQVVDPATGTVLWQLDPGVALLPGSTAKLLTAAAALLALDSESRLRTAVVAGAEPGTVVLVGGGDPTLSALPAGEESVYPGAARLDDLVAQVQRAAGAPVRRVVVDANAFAGEVLAPGWFPADVPAGYVAPIVPVMLDGGRDEPTVPDTARTAAPGLAAGQELASRLGADPTTVEVGSAPPGARLLGEVFSAPVEQLVSTAVRTSDNVLAEALARQVALASEQPPSFDGGARAVLGVLAANGFDTAGTVLVDGSGLSTQDRVSAALLAAILAAAAGPDERDPRTARLRPLLDGLPVAGGDGTLADRYLAGAALPARGFVRAKTGTLTGVSSLAGTVVDVDGRLLVFALLSNGPDAGVARPRLDAVAAALRSCGCR